jgi:predicted nucleotidyltransferase
MPPLSCALLSIPYDRGIPVTDTRGRLSIRCFAMIKQPIWTASPEIPYNKSMEKLREMLKEVLARHQDIKLCIVFGSIATAKSSLNSDLDIAVAGEQPLSPDKFLELIDAFSAAANHQIDLVDLMTASGEIFKQALSTGVIVQNLDKNLYARLISRMLFNQTDMMPYYRRTLQERRRRFLNG